MVEADSHFIVEMLRRIQADIVDIKTDSYEIKTRLGLMETQGANLQTHIAQLQTQVAELSVRMDRRDGVVDRVLRRLELTEQPT